MRQAVVIVLLALLIVPALAGRTEGPVRHHDVVLEDSADRYQTNFEADETAEITICADSADDDLDLEVRDENGNLIRSDYTSSGRFKVSWVPKWRGEFTVRVINCMRHDVGYTIITN